jgi:hypothetical protein
MLGSVGRAGPALLPSGTYGKGRPSAIPTVRACMTLDRMYTYRTDVCCRSHARNKSRGEPKIPSRHVRTDLSMRRPAGALFSLSIHLIFFLSSSFVTYCRWNPSSPAKTSMRSVRFDFLSLFFLSQHRSIALISTYELLGFVSLSLLYIDVSRYIFSLDTFV